MAGVARLVGDRFQLASPETRENALPWGSGSFGETAADGLLLSNGRQVYRWQYGVWRMETEAVDHQHGLCSTTDGRIVAVGHLAPNRGAFVEWQTNQWVTQLLPFVLTGGGVIQVKRPRTRRSGPRATTA